MYTYCMVYFSCIYIHNYRIARYMAIGGDTNIIKVQAKSRFKQ